MVRARFTGNNHYHEGEPLDNGDVVELSEEQYEQWAYQFERLDDGPASDETAEADSSETSEVDGDASPSEDEDTEEESEEASETDVDDAADLTVSELEERLADGEFDDRLDELEIAERSRDEPRSTALDAIEERKEQV